MRQGEKRRTCKNKSNSAKSAKTVVSDPVILGGAVPIIMSFEAILSL